MLWLRFTTVNNIGNMTINGKNMFVKLDFILSEYSTFKSFFASYKYFFQINLSPCWVDTTVWEYNHMGLMHTNTTIFSFFVIMQGTSL